MVEAMSKNTNSKSDAHLRTWWEAEDRAGAVCAVVKRARERDGTREEAIRRNLGHYLLRKVHRLDAWSYDTVRAPRSDDPKMPLVASICDSVHAKLLRSVPRTVPITRNATWTMQRQAQYLEAFIDGVKARNRFNDIFSDVILDAEIACDGFVWVQAKIEREDGEKAEGEIKIERVYPWQVRVDPAEAAHGKPRSMFLELTMDRRVAMARWPKFAKSIAMAPRAESGPAYHSHADQVSILVGWHLKSGCDASDGRTVVVCEGVDKPLEDAPYSLDSFPLVRFSWKRPRIGYWGHSLVDGISGIHETLNQLDESISTRMAQSFGMIFNYLGEGMKVTIDNSNEIPVYNMSGADKDAIQYIAPNLVPAEQLNERQSLFDFGYRFSGASQLSAAGMKPAGLDSGVALREYQDIETERFTVQGEEMERFDRDVTTLIVDIARMLHEQGVALEVNHRTRRRRKPITQRIRWADVSLKEGDYALDTSPASQVPKELAGQIAIAEQMIAAGIIQQPSDAARLMDHPDIEAVLRQQLAPYYIVLDMIEDMIEDRKARSPIPEMDLAMTQQIGRLAILQAQIDDVPEDRIGLVRAFVEQARVLEQRGQQAAAQQAAMANPQSMGGNPAQGAGPFVPNPAGALQPGLPSNAAPQGQAVI